MTCREFKHSAASLNLWELTRSEDEQVLEHSEKCEPCGSWLRKQRTLAVSMQTLQARTAGLEAGPDVERALLRAFRHHTHQGGDPVFSDVAERIGPLRPAVTPLSTPVALRLSRYFEVGAYVAMAAALLVGVFLGVQLLQHRPNAITAQVPNAPSGTEASRTEAGNRGSAGYTHGPASAASSCSAEAVCAFRQECRSHSGEQRLADRCRG